MFLLDTNVVIAALNERPPVIARRLDAEMERGTPLLISSVVLFELRYGIARSARRTENTARLDLFLQGRLSFCVFDRDDATEAGAIRASLESKGEPIGPYDILIAAQARRRNAILVTGNRREFGRFDGLMVTDWAA
jgi:tRNA(fMet)-specific endonuclease VapC